MNLVESQMVDADDALSVGMSEKAKEFVETGSEIYHGADGGGGHDH